MRAAALLDDEPPLDGEDEEFDEEHAARDRAITTTAAPAVVTCCLRRSCISGTPFRFHMFSPAAMSAAPDSRSACKPWCQYSLAALPLPAGKRVEYRWGTESQHVMPQVPRQSSGGGGA